MCALPQSPAASAIGVLKTGGIRVCMCVCVCVGHAGGERYGLACVTAGAECWRLFV